MIVPFDHMAGFILSGYKPLYLSLFNKDLTFSIENYIKCNLHMPIMLEIYGRDIYTYRNSLKYLEGQEDYLLDCGEVLKYFYSDILDMICSVLKRYPELPYSITLDSRVGVKDSFPVKQYSLSSAIKEMSSMLSFNEVNWETGLGGGVVVRFSDSEFSRLEPTPYLALASILTHYLHEDYTPAILEVGL